MQFQITFTGLSADELAEVVDTFGVGGDRSVTVRSGPSLQFTAETGYLTDLEWTAFQLRHLTSLLDRLAERQAEPTIAGHKVGFSGSGDSSGEYLYVQVDGLDVAGLHAPSDDVGTLHAFPLPSAEKGGPHMDRATKVWPISPDRT